MTYTWSAGCKALGNAKLDIRNFLKVEILVLAISASIESLGLFPAVANYVITIINLIIAVFSLNKVFASLNRFPIYFVSIALFIGYCLWSAFTSGVNIVYVLWSSLSLTRPFVFGLLLLAYWNKSDLCEFVELMFKVQWVNLACVAVQFLCGNIQDLVGGIFGSWIGCNIPLNLYLCLVTVCALNAYFSQVKEIDSKYRSSSYLLFTLMSSLVVASIAEIKFFYVELVLVAVFSLVIHRPTKRTFFVIAAMFLVLTVGGAVFYALMPDRFSILLSFDSMYSEGDIRGAGYGTSRVQVYNQLGSVIFGGNFERQIYGLGFGSFANSSMAAFTSPLYSIYSSLRMDLLSSAIIFCELGFLGTVIYILVAVACSCSGTKVLRREPSSFGSFARGVSFCGLLLFVSNFYYNSSASSVYSIAYAYLLCSAMVASKRGSRLVSACSDSSKVGLE